MKENRHESYNTWKKLQINVHNKLQKSKQSNYMWWRSWIWDQPEQLQIVTSSMEDLNQGTADFKSSTLNQSARLPPLMFTELYSKFV